MPQHRKNKAPWAGDKSQHQEWFLANKKRQRAKKDIAKASKRKNRGK